MTALPRQHQKIFAINATQSQVTAFRTTENDEQTFSKQPDVIQTERFTSGWLNEDNTGNMSPFVEDMNGVLLTLSYNTAYLLEKGIPEYSESQTYYINSFCQYLGHLYRCKVDNTTGYLPTNTEKWEYIHTEAYSTASVGTGESIVATPSESTFNFKSLVAGTNVTLTPSPEGDAITISASMNGYADFIASSPLTYSNGVLTIAQANNSTNGYLSSSDWTSFNSKLSSTIFSANNSWSGTNTFRDIVPEGANYKLGSSSKYWEYAYSKYVYLSSNAYLFANYTGDSGNSLFINWYSTSSSKARTLRLFNNHIDVTHDNEVSLGQETLRWANVYSTSFSFNSVAKLGIGSNGRSIQFNTANSTDVKRSIIFNPDYAGFFPEQNGVISLGHPSYAWSNGHFTGRINADSAKISMLGTGSGVGGSTGATDFYITTNANNTISDVRWTIQGAQFYPTDSTRINYNIGLASGSHIIETVYARNHAPVSDKYIKENIIPLKNNLAKVLALNPVSYDYIDTKQHSCGFIAQEVEQVFDEAVIPPKDYPEKDGLYALNYNAIIALAVGAIKELSAKVTDLENKLEAINGH